MERSLPKALVSILPATQVYGTISVRWLATSGSVSSATVSLNAPKMSFKPTLSSSRAFPLPINFSGLQNPSLSTL